MLKINNLCLIATAAAIGLALVRLLAPEANVRVELSRLGDIPVSVFRPLSTADGPVVVVAHGFAGSQQLMQPMAMTLASAGYTAVTFDFAGHGRNATPLSGGIKDMAESTRALLAEIDRVAIYARGLGAPGRPIALVGHSMAADLVVQYAMGRNDIAAVVALSVFGGGVTATEPRNLLVVDGAWEPAMLTDAGYRIAGMAANGLARERVTYGDLAAGTARRFVLAAGAEHIGVIYSLDALTEARDWLNAAFGRTDAGVIDRRGKWLALLFAGLVAMASSLARLLPVLSPTPLGAGLGWRRMAPVAIAPAILTPLLLWKAPTDFLPVLLGDYLVIHFIVYGVLTAVGLWLTRARAMPAIPRPSWTRVIVIAAPVATYYIVVMGAPIDLFVTSFMPTAMRWLIIPAMFVGTSLYFLTDEWLTRGAGAARGGYAFSKACFLASLLGAVALNPTKLFFLIILVPVLLILFVVYGLVNRWIYRRVNDPRAAALGAAAALAWAIAVTFPIVG